MSLMNFSELTNKTLDDLDLHTQATKINSQEYRDYFISESGKEHYRLLKWISLNNQGRLFLDVGTLKGCSALALSSNKNNSVKSFNLADQLDLNDIPENIEFIVGNILDPQYKSVVISSSYILLDTFHDGNFEKEFVEYLETIKWSGYLLLDDIYLNKEMKEFWNSIIRDKKDITNLGHLTGTGLVFFN
jgi:hypothetical protein